MMLLLQQEAAAAAAAAGGVSRVYEVSEMSRGRLPCSTASHTSASHTNIMNLRAHINIH